MAPGRYAAKIGKGDLCYWSRNKHDSGDLDDVIANDLVTGPARTSVTVKKREYFESKECGTWRKVG